MGREQSPPVQFRSLEIERELETRANGQALGHVARRDLERYYHALQIELASVALSQEEAMLICDALNGIAFLDPVSVGIFWAEIDDAIRLDRLAEKWQVDGPALVEKLRALHYAQKLALVDAIERWWQRDDLNERPRAETPADVGLQQQPKS